MRQSQVMGAFMNQTGYLMFRCKNGTIVPAHRYVWQSHYGKIASKLEVHHKNNDKLDNNISNFELVTKAENLILREVKK